MQWIWNTFESILEITKPEFGVRLKRSTTKKGKNPWYYVRTHWININTPVYTWNVYMLTYMEVFILLTVMDSPTVWRTPLVWYPCTVLNYIWPLQYPNPVEILIYFSGYSANTPFNPCVCPFLSLCSLKLECEKLASEKTEMQRHYIMVSPIRSLPELYSDLLVWLRISEKTLIGSYTGITISGVVSTLLISWIDVF